MSDFAFYLSLLIPIAWVALFGLQWLRLRKTVGVVELVSAPGIQKLFLVTNVKTREEATFNPDIPKLNDPFGPRMTYWRCESIKTRRAGKTKFLVEVDYVFSRPLMLS